MNSPATGKRSPTTRRKSRKKTVSLPRKLAFVALGAALGFAAIQRLENGPTVATAHIGSSNMQTSAEAAQAANAIAISPAPFETNKNQWSKDVHDVARGPRYSLALTSQGPALTVNTAIDAKTASLRFLEGNRNVAIEPLEKASARTKDVTRSDKNPWETDVDKVAYRNIYPGIDVVFYGHQQELEYDFVVAPHANPKRILFRYDGADRIDISNTGELLIYLADEVITQKAPVVYQVVGGTRRFIYGAYDERDGAIGFRLANYDVSLPLYIDPVDSYPISALAGRTRKHE